MGCLATHSLRCLAVFFFALVLQSCGGGGGSSVPDKGNSSANQAYTGSRTQALVDESNAEELALGSYRGGQLGGSLGSLSASSTVTSNLNEGSAFELTQALKNSFRQIQPESLLVSSSAAPSSASKTAYAKTLAGQCGGTAKLTGDADETTGKITGTIIFNDYCVDNRELSGSASFSGIYNSNLRIFTSFSQSFSDLSYSGRGAYVKMTGDIAWAVASNLTEATTLDLTLHDLYREQLYWLNNYRFTTTYNSDSISQQVTGRYYDYTYGYVDFATTAPLITYPSNTWPSSGGLNFNGPQNGLISLTFATSTLTIEVDEDGDKSWDWSREENTYPVTPPPTDNQAPVANAGPDQTVAQGALVTLDASASSDPDNDPLSYYWRDESCPNDHCSSFSSGTEIHPAFRPENAGTYVFSLRVYDGRNSSVADQVSVSVQPVIQQSPSLLQEEWRFGLYGTRIANSGLNTIDLDNDGILEIVTDGQLNYENDIWYVVKNTGDGEYQQVWSSLPSSTRISRLIAAKPAGDSVAKVFLALQDGTIEVYNGLTFVKETTTQLGSNIVDMEIADVDNDGQSELILTDGVKTYVYSADTLLEEFTLESYGGNDIAIGNIDTDPAMEIIISFDDYDNQHGYVIDAGTRALEWDYPNGFGEKLAVGDVDGDGLDEIVAMGQWTNITVIDADIKTPSWEIATSETDSLFLADINNDGIQEILYGEYYIHCVDGQTQQELWMIDNPGSSINNIATGDVDQDGDIEVLWGTSYSRSHLYLAKADSGEIEWQSQHLDEPLSAVDVGDVDDDGEDEIVLAAYADSVGNRGVVMQIFNAESHELEWSSLVNPSAYTGANTVKIGDVDDDGETEFVLATARYYGGLIQVYNGKTHTLEAESAVYDNLFTDIEVADVDNDGQTEIITGETSGPYLVVLNGASLTEEWRSVSLADPENYVLDIQIGDTDQDGNPEIIGVVGTSYIHSSSLSKVYAYDGVSHQLDWLVETAAHSAQIADTDLDGSAEILLGNDDGTIDIYSGVDFTFQKTRLLPLFTAISSFRVSDIDRDGTDEWLIGSDGRLSVFSNMADSLLWQSGFLGEDLGEYNHLVAKDIDGDGATEVVFGTDVKLYQFEMQQVNNP